MADLLHELLATAAARTPMASALRYRDERLDYAELAARVHAFAASLHGLALERAERVAIYLPKQTETVLAMYGSAAAGGVFVPINPLLKPAQVEHILRDCNARVLVTSTDRAEVLGPSLARCGDLHTVLAIGAAGPSARYGHVQVLDWHAFHAGAGAAHAHRCIDTDMAAILYTSGSTGQPKGVVLSHRNMVAGARSVASYLENTAEDRLLAVLPFSFDYGLSQLSTAFHVGASVSLINYLLPMDVVKAVARDAITGLAAVPPLWTQLAQLEWPAEAVRSLRYITNSGGAMPTAVTAELRRRLPATRVYLMYGLTEAFRSTYLPPEELDRRPESMGKAIPNAEVMVVREDGSPCAPGEPGELVHRGALVALGYWNDPARTAERFKPAPGQAGQLPMPEIAVWSGDTVRKDEDGFLYFVARRDETIKTSGYRVSPTEVEEVLYASEQVKEAVVLGVPHAALGQGILAVVVPDPERYDGAALLTRCKRDLPGYMVPLRVETVAELPRNPNGKIDRRALAEEFRDAFAGLPAA